MNHFWQTDRQIDRETQGESERERETDRQTDRQTDRFSLTVAVPRSSMHPHPAPSPPLSPPSTADSGTVQQPLDIVSLYKIEEDRCSQVLINRKDQALAAVNFAAARVTSVLAAASIYREVNSQAGVKPEQNMQPKQKEQTNRQGNSRSTSENSGQNSCQNPSLVPLVSLDPIQDSLGALFAGLKKGTCASQGYTEVDGTKTVTLLLLGRITISFFKRSGRKYAWRQDIPNPAVQRLFPGKKISSSA